MNDEYILDRLMQGGAVSGEALSREMNLSRAAVWKGILRLREAGWQIEAAPRVGYRLVPPGDSLLPCAIYPGLETRVLGRRIEYHTELDSTNARARTLAQSGGEDGLLVIAEKQTAGRGRLDRRWESPPGLSAYMSLLLRPGVPVQRLALLTPAVALGMCRALSSFCDDAVRIKWPNDIVCCGHKLCGILLDAQAGLDGVDWVVAGMGVNVHQRAEDFPEEMRRTAASLDMMCGKRLTRADVVRAVLRELERALGLYLAGRDSELLREYSLLSATLGQRVRVISPSGEYEADALAIQPDGALTVRRDDGAETAVYAGDVSVRGIMGYAGEG